MARRLALAVAFLASPSPGRASRGLRSVVPHFTSRVSAHNGSSPLPFARVHVRRSSSAVPSSRRSPHSDIPAGDVSAIARWLSTQPVPLSDAACAELERRHGANALVAACGQALADSPPATAPLADSPPATARAKAAVASLLDWRARQGAEGIDWRSVVAAAPQLASAGVPLPRPLLSAALSGALARHAEEDGAFSREVNEAVASLCVGGLDASAADLSPLSWARLSEVLLRQNRRSDALAAARAAANGVKERRAGNGDPAFRSGAGDVDGDTAAAWHMAGRTLSALHALVRERRDASSALGILLEMHRLGYAVAPRAFLRVILACGGSPSAARPRVTSAVSSTVAAMAAARIPMDEASFMVCLRQLRGRGAAALALRAHECAALSPDPLSSRAYDLLLRVLSRDPTFAGQPAATVHALMRDRGMSPSHAVLSALSREAPVAGERPAAAEQAPPGHTERAALRLLRGAMRAGVGAAERTSVTRDVLSQHVPSDRLFRAVVSVQRTPTELLAACDAVGVIMAAQLVKGAKLSRSRASALDKRVRLFARVAGDALAALDGGPAAAVDYLSARGQNEARDAGSGRLSLSVCLRALATHASLVGGADALNLLRPAIGRLTASNIALSAADYGEVGAVYGAGAEIRGVRDVLEQLFARLRESARGGGAALPSDRMHGEATVAAACVKCFVTRYVATCPDVSASLSLLQRAVVLRAGPNVSPPYERVLALLASTAAQPEAVGGVFAMEEAAKSVFMAMMHFASPTPAACASLLSVLASGQTADRVVHQLLTAPDMQAFGADAMRNLRAALAGACGIIGNSQGLQQLFVAVDMREMWQLAAVALAASATSGMRAVLAWFEMCEQKWLFDALFTPPAMVEALCAAAVGGANTWLVVGPGRQLALRWHGVVATEMSRDRHAVGRASRALAQIGAASGDAEFLGSTVDAIVRAHGQRNKGDVPDEARRVVLVAAAKHTLSASRSEEASAFGRTVSLVGAVAADWVALAAHWSGASLNSVWLLCQAALCASPPVPLPRFLLEDVVRRGLSERWPLLHKGLLALADTTLEIGTPAFNAALNAAVTAGDASAIERIAAKMAQSDAVGDDVTRNILVKHYGRAGDRASLETVLASYPQLTEVAATEAVAAFAARREWTNARHFLNLVRARMSPRPIAPYLALALPLMAAAAREIASADACRESDISASASSSVAVREVARRMREHLAEGAAIPRDAQRFLSLAHDALTMAASDGAPRSAAYLGALARYFALNGAGDKVLATLRQLASTLRPPPSSAGAEGTFVTIPTLRVRVAASPWRDATADALLSDVVAVYGPRRDSRGLKKLVRGLFGPDVIYLVDAAPFTGPATMSAMVVALARAGDVSGAQSAFKGMMLAGNVPDVKAVTVICTVLPVDEARVLLERAQAAGAKLDGRACDPLVRRLAEAGRGKEAMDSLRWMTSCDVVPMLETVVAVANAAGWQGDMTVALKAARLAVGKLPRRPVDPAVERSLLQQAWASAVRAFCERGETAKAREAMHEAETAGVAVSWAARTFLMHALGRAGRMAEAIALLDAAPDPDLLAFNAALQAAAQAEDVAAAEGVVSRMKSAGVRPNSASYATLARVRSIAGDALGVLDVLRDAIADGVPPDRRLVSQVELGLTFGKRIDLLPEMHRMVSAAAAQRRKDEEERKASVQ